MTDTDSQNLIADLLIKWEDSFEDGSEIPADELCLDHPDLLQELQRQINALKKMAWMNHDTDEDPSENCVGRVLNQRYEIKSLIGSGGYGNVFKAFDVELERFVAVKVPHGHRTESNTDEAKVAARFQTDGIVSVHDVGNDNGIEYIVSELVDGVNLREYSSKNNLTWKQAAKLVSSVATNLQKAHDVDLIHRDIKPENILIDKEGKPHIADFGITSSTSDLGIQKGTLSYMSPEQIAGESQIVDERSDIYSLGTVLFELLTGMLPHASQNSEKLREQILLAEPDFNSIEPEQLQDVCRRALAKHPDARYQSVTNLSKALNDCLSNRQLVKPVWNRRLWLGAAVAGLLTVSFIVGSFWKGMDWSSLKGGEYFDGTKRIVTDVDSFYPCTIEAWIAPSTHDKQQWIVGSDVPSQFGIGIGIKDGHPMIETIRGGMHDPDTEISLNKWSHLAGVFGEKETRLYLNGKLVGTCPPTEAPVEQSRFVVGNLGEKHQTQYFTGRIRSVRISDGELYDGAFTPKQDLLADNSTAFVFGNKDD